MGVFWSANPEQDVGAVGLCAGPTGALTPWKGGTKRILYIDLHKGQAGIAGEQLFTLRIPQ